MRALIIVHDPGSQTTLVGERLVQHGIELVDLEIATFDDPSSDVPFPDPTDFDLIVPMGAIWSVYDEATIGTWIGRELEFLRAAGAAGVPVFGICFGFQALASAHGGRTIPADTPQVGWCSIESSVPDVIAEGPWMEWHYDRSDPPADAEILARDATCVQAFRLRSNLGVQFHPEVDLDHVERWLHGGGHELMTNEGRSVEELLADTAAHWPSAKAKTFRLVDWFLTEFVGLTDLDTSDLDPQRPITSSKDDRHV
ncbi:MAG: gamma-glutamyl-gamma-aminobutyrate hydrolase family protein [Acidimicrobiales bacterium]